MQLKRYYISNFSTKELNYSDIKEILEKPAEKSYLFFAFCVFHWADRNLFDFNNVCFHKRVRLFLQWYFCISY